MLEATVAHHHAGEEKKSDEMSASTAGEALEGMDLDHIWRRPDRRNLPTEGDLIARFEVISAKILPAVENANTKKYVLYKIHIRMEGTNDAGDTAILERRYTELLNLYDALRKDYSTVLAEITFPKKRIMGNFSEAVIAERGAAFETFLDFIITTPVLRESPIFLEFIQGDELRRACLLLDERRHELAIPLLENCFRVLNKIYLDKSRAVLLMLCRLVAACTGSPIPHPNAEQWVNLALRRFEHVSDVEILVLYVPLIQTCVKYLKTKGEEYQMLEERLAEMGKKGIKVKGNLPLLQAIHVMDPRSETA